MKKIFSLFLLLCSFTIFSSQTTVIIKSISKTGNSGMLLGQVTFKDTRYGLLILPKLHNLTPGLHGFHIHIIPSCAKYGMAAGGHLDPKHTGKHLGPYNPKGHLGDLPVLYVQKNGISNTPTLAPRLTVQKITGHSLMIHAGGDNYSDSPEKLGGGGKRIACGIIRK